jgi:LPS export ABC transporter protein LptC
MPGSAGKDSRRPDLSRSPRRRRGDLPALVLVSLLAGCSIDYKGAAAETQTTEGIPDTTAVRVLHRVHKDGHLSLEMAASRAVSFNAKNETILSDARFTAYDDQGAPSTEGQARTVVFHTDTENAEITGGVRVHSTSEKGDVTAESLYWEDKTRKLTAPPAETVSLRKDDGSSLRGTGFAGDFLRREITFSGPVRGSYVYQEK